MGVVVPCVAWSGGKVLVREGQGKERGRTSVVPRHFNVLTTVHAFLELVAGAFFARGAVFYQAQLSRFFSLTAAYSVSARVL